MSQSQGDERIADMIETYRDTIHPLYQFVSRRAGRCRQLAEDITQETYLRAVVQWRNRRRPENVLAWLQTVARNLLLNHYRHKSPESLEASHVECVLETEPVDGPDVGARELKAVLMEAAGPEEELVGLEKRIARRASFLTGELSATEVELQGMRLAAVTARNMAARQVEILVEQHKRFTNLSERGLVSGSEFRAVEAELRAVEAHVELAGLELRILDQKIEDALEE